MVELDNSIRAYSVSEDETLTPCVYYKCGHRVEADLKKAVERLKEKVFGSDTGLCLKCFKKATDGEDYECTC